MARGGITEHNVEQARKRILDRGENPSIDAVRVELGNTGSKTTISRHLKAIEERAQRQIDNQKGLSDHLKNLVGELSAQLLQEAQDKIDAAEERHRAELAEVEGALKTSLAEQEKLRQENLSMTEERDGLMEEGAQLMSDLSDLNSDLRAQAQHIKDLEELLEERKNTIASLERWQDHQRVMLEGFQAKSKEQRAEDLEKYERAIHEAQTKARNMENELGDKAREKVELTREISRLHTELMETRKTLAKVDSKFEDEQIAHRQTIEGKVRLEEELIGAKQERDTLKVDLQEKEQQKARADRLQVELDVTKDLLEAFKREPVAPKKDETEGGGG